jgi:tetratricopeptide (TPR) repeat protein
MTIGDDLHAKAAACRNWIATRLTVAHPQPRQNSTLTTLHDLRARAASGDADADYELGMMYWIGQYRDGEFIGPDLMQADALLKSAANKGHPEASRFVQQQDYLEKYQAFASKAKAAAEVKAAERENQQKAKALNDRIDQVINDYDPDLKINPQDIKDYYRDNRFYSSIRIHLYRAILDEDWAKVCYFCGVIYQQKGQWDHAIKNYDQVLKSNPQNAYIYRNRGNAYHRKGQWDRAIEDDDHALKIDPQFAEVYYERGNLLKKKGQWRRALEDYDQALKIKPGSKVYHRDRSVVIAKIEGRACPEERECPACGSAAVARILYGYPRFTDELNQRLAEGTVALGGCCIDKDSPDWHCNHCGYEWGDSRQQLLPEESQKQIAQEKAREEQELAEADQRGVMTITEIHGGFAKCPYCGWRFPLYNPRTWDGERHGTCKTRLRLPDGYKISYPAAATPSEPAMSVDSSNGVKPPLPT